MINHPQQVKKLGQKNEFHGTLGFDYFFTMRDGFKWNNIPPFVIGRPVFDNWLVCFLLHIFAFMSVHFNMGRVHCDDFVVVLLILYMKFTGLD